MIGAGKYDDLLVKVLKQCSGHQGLLIVLDGKKGPGVSMKATPETMIFLADYLDRLAKNIKVDAEKIKKDMK